METPWYLIGAVVVISSALGSYLTTYFTKKAENLATKEDIEEITAKIETVKSEVGYVSQQRLAVRESERTVIFDLMDDCLMLLQDKLYVVYLTHSVDPTISISEHHIEVVNLFAKIRIDYNKLNAYFEEDHPIKIAAQDVAKFSNRMLVTYMKSHIQSNRDTVMYADQVLARFDSYQRDLQEPMAELDRLLDVFSSKVRDYFREISQPDAD